MASLLGRSPLVRSRTLALMAFAALGCQPPPKTAAPVGVAWDAGAPEAGVDDAGRCVTPGVDDPRADARANCRYTAGMLATETLPISEPTRAAIPIKHVVVVMKENRAFDHLFGKLHDSGQAEVEAVPASFSNLDNSGTAVAPFHLATTCVDMDPGHQWNEMHRQVDGGKMDGFVANGADTTGGDGHFVMGYYDATDIPFYYWMANTFAINDRHFPSARSGTWPDRDFLLLGTADGVTCSYCGYPNPETRTLFDNLDAAGVTWGAFTDGEPFDDTLGWKPGHVGLYSFEDFLAKARDGTLPGVSFVDGIAWVQDEHPTADVQAGEQWTRVLYEALRTSPEWSTTAMIWTYDEAGGFADHVAPPNEACVARPGNSLDAPFVELGVRVPLVVISPYARPHYVSHVIQDHTAITRFIETVFGLPALTARDANMDALLDMFDFGCPPALLEPPQSPAAGMGGCHGEIVLTSDKPSYVSADAMTIRIDFSGVPSPSAHDRLALYKYPRAAAEVPSESNPIDPVAWGYLGGQGHVAAGAPASGAVVIDKSVISAGATWPPPPGLWIVLYMPALASGADGHTPGASIDVEVTP